MTTGPCWIAVRDYDEADAQLRTAYDKTRSPSGQIDNLYKAYSLMPHAIVPADDLYRATLHNEANTLPKWLSELIGTAVAIFDECLYAETNHGRNFAYLWGDESQAQAMLQAVRERRFADVATDRETAILHFVEKQTLQPQKMEAPEVEALRTAGLTDTEILEVVQVAASFSYFTRVINALGISLEGDKIGFYE